MKVRLVVLVLVLALAGAVGGALAHRAPSHASADPASVSPGGGWWDWDGIGRI